MNRRRALKLFAAAPFAAKEAAAQGASQAAAQEAAALTGAQLGLPAVGMPFYGSRLKEIAALSKVGLLPGWAQRQVRRHAVECCRMMSADVACLRSVSLGGKFRIQADRNEREMLARMDANWLDFAAQDEFFTAQNGAGARTPQAGIYDLLR